MPGPGPWSFTAARLRIPKRYATWHACCTRAARFAAISAFVFASTFSPGWPGSRALAERTSVTTVLQNYSRAIADPTAEALDHVTISGIVNGSGLTGSFRTWRQPERERTDEHLGPSEERTLRIGKRYFYRDPSGDVRELTGSLARRARTDHFIDSGEFARQPDRCVLRGRSVVRERPTYVLDVTAENGATETLYLDAQTFLPARIAYDEDDGRSTNDLSDWRSVGGHRFAYLSIASDGNHDYDTKQITTSIDLGSGLEPALFATFVPRTIEMSAPETVALEMRGGHLYAPVTIAGRSYSFLVDTGAQSVLIDRRVAKELALPVSGDFEASGTARTGGLAVAKLAELRVGSRGKLSNIVVTALDLTATSDGTFRADGILGYPFFASALVRLDIAARTMTFAAPGGFVSHGETLALDVDRGLPEASLRLNDTLLAPFVIDTGNAAELLLYDPFVRKHGGVVPFAPGRHESYGIGGATPSYRSVLARLDFGTATLYNVDTDVMLSTSGAFADRTDAGNAGLGILRNFTLTFDEPHALLYVERGADFDDGHARN